MTQTFHRQRRRIIAVLLLFVSLSGILSARAQSEDLIINDPAVRHGVLSNGLSYYVKANPKPKGKAELRLAVRAGSLLEDSDQLGLAHFLEHMLFNGTEKFPRNELVDVLESFGMEFGPEINAFTTFDQTVYRLNVKSDDKAQFELGLDVLEEWAFNATLTEEDFNEERGVVLEEWRSGRGAQARMLDEVFPVLFQGSQYAERRPIGDPEIIKNAPVEALRRFYKDWYRPDLMAVIAVGDFDPDETVALIRERFGGHPKQTNPRPVPDFPIPRHDETLVSIVSDKEATNSRVQIYVKHEPQDIRFRPDIKKDLAEQLFFVMFNQRLEEISRTENPPFLYGYGFTTTYSQDTALGGLAAAVSEDTVLSGLEALLLEAERVRSYGFLEVELDRAKRDVFSYFENYWKQRNDMESSNLVQPLLDAFTNGDFYPSIDWQWSVVSDLLPAVTLDEVAAIGDVLLSESNRVVIVNGPSVPAITNLREEDIRTVLARSEQSVLSPWVDDSVSGELVPNPPEPGKLVSQSEIPNTGITRWELSNGATIFVKPTDFKSEEILFQAVSLGGDSLVEDAEYLSAQFAVNAVTESGLGDFSADNLRKALAGKNVTLNPFLRETYEGFSGSSSPQDLETMLQLLYLSHTEPRRDPTAWKSLMGRVSESLRNRESSPITRYEDLVQETLYNNHFRSRPMTLDKLDEVNLDEALNIYSERFANAADFSYIFIGDVEPDELQPLVERWIGGLPGELDAEAGLSGGGTGETWIDRGMRSPEGRREVAMEAGTEPLSVVTQVWNGEWDGSFLERYRIQSLAAALEMKFTRAIREESGGSYSIAVYPQINLAPVKDYRFIVRFSCSPDRVEELTTAVKDIINEWKSSPPESKFATDVATSQKRSLQENLERNAWWLGQMFFAVVTGTDSEVLLNREALYDSLNPKILSETAQRYLDDDNYLEIVLYPKNSGN